MQRHAQADSSYKIHVFPKSRRNRHSFLQYEPELMAFNISTVTVASIERVIVVARCHISFVDNFRKLSVYP